MRIFIDATCLGRRKTGNETYIRGLLSGFSTQRVQDSGLKIKVLTTAAHDGERVDAFEWIEIDKGNFFSRNFHTIPDQLKSTNAEIYHATYWTRWWDTRPKKVVMIHDISFVSFPQGFHKHEQLFYANVIRQVAKSAEHILTVSEYSKQDMMERWKLPADKITVTYDGIDSCFTPVKQGACGGESVRGAKVKPEVPYILYVGNLHPRKNLVRLLDAYVMLKEQEKVPHRLKIVGQNAWLTGEIFEAVCKHGLENEVEFTGYVSQEELITLYQKAYLSVYPSLFEGFGLPPLEAMACGCPVVTSNTTSLPEVAGNACVLVSPESVDEIAAGMHQVISDVSLRESLIAKGPVQAAKFTWNRCAGETLRVYKSVLGL